MIIWIYDGSVEGFMSVIHESYHTRTIPDAIHRNESTLTLLDDIHVVTTNPDHAAKVFNAIRKHFPKSYLT